MWIGVRSGVSSPATTQTAASRNRCWENTQSMAIFIAVARSTLAGLIRIVSQ